MKLVLTPKVGEGIALTFAKMPSIGISSTCAHKDDSSLPIYNEVTWSISGVLMPNDGALSTQISTLETLLKVGRLETAVITSENEVIIISLAHTTDIKIKSYAFPNGSGPEYITKRTFTIELVGKEYIGAAATDGTYSYTISYNTDQSLAVTREISLTNLCEAGANAVVKADALIATMEWDTWAGANRTSKRQQSNDLGTMCTTSISHLTYWIAFTSGITNAESSTSYDIDSQGVVTIKKSGWFEGPALTCANEIDIIAASYSYLTHTTTTRNSYANRTSYLMEGLGSIGDGNNEIYFSQETLSISAAVIDFIFKPVLGGGVPVRQVTAKTTAKATQSGIRRGLNSYPAIPAYKWASTAVKSQTITQSPPQLKRNSTTKCFEVQYVINYEFDATPTF